MIAPQVREKLQLLQELAQGYGQNSPEKSLAFAQQALTLAVEQDDPGAEVTASHRISTACFLLNRSQEALPYLERALVLCEQLEDLPGTVNTLGDLSGSLH